MTNCRRHSDCVRAAKKLITLRGDGAKISFQTLMRMALAMDLLDKRHPELSDLSSDAYFLACRDIATAGDRPREGLGDNPFEGRVTKIPGFYHYQIFWSDGRLLAVRKENNKYSHAVIVESSKEVKFCKDGWSAEKHRAAFQRNGQFSYIVELLGDYRWNTFRKEEENDEPT